MAAALQAIEQRMNVHFLYGVRGFGRYEHEVILVDAGAIAGETINPYKFYLCQRWGLPCSQHESNWEFSFFLNAGEPLYEAVDAVTAGSVAHGPALHHRARVAGAAGRLQRAAAQR